MTLLDFIAESNAIEGVYDDPVKYHTMYEKFIALKTVSVGHLEKAALAFEPKALLRDKPGMDVRIGNYFPIFGGPRVREELNNILALVQSIGVSAPFLLHCEYEKLHPFMDGNGRTGRLLWLWQMKRRGWNGPHGFLQTFYYQTLAHQGR